MNIKQPVLMLVISLLFGLAPAFAFAQATAPAPVNSTASILQQLYDELIKIEQMIVALQQQQTPPPAQTAPQIYSIAPASGAVGDEVTIKGFGFTDDNTIHFGNGILLHVPSSGGVGIMCAIGATNCHSGINQSLTFAVPSTNDPACETGEHQCFVASKPITPGVYQVSVENANGTSASVTFMVSTSSPQAVSTSTPNIYNIQPSSGPIGTSVTIGGNNFGSDATIRFGGGMIAHVTPKPAVFFCPMIPAGSNQTCGSYAQTITFAVPDSLPPYCTTEVCALYLMLVQPGSYQVSVVNNDTKMESTSTTFTVTAQ
jgi:hypothetical protein